MAVAIRGIALGEVDRSMLRRILKRELLVGLMSGLVIGLTTALIAITFNYKNNHGVLLGIVVWMLLRQEAKRRQWNPILLATLLAWSYFVRPTNVISIAAITRKVPNIRARSHVLIESFRSVEVAPRFVAIAPTTPTA